MTDFTKEIEELKKRISQLEKKNNFQAFGRSYSQIGDQNSDFLIKTKGQVKIQWGSKFIDLIKDGKINSDSKFIYQSSSVGEKEGIYVIEENGEFQIYLKIIGLDAIPLAGQFGTSYVSFLEKQETSSEEKYQALQNIGFIYPDIQSIDDYSLKDGIVYIESEQKLYIIKNGNVSEYIANIPNTIKGQFIISKESSEKGLLLIKGEGINNSISFDNMVIYNEDSNSIIDSNENIQFRINNNKYLVINNKQSIFYNKVISSSFQSSYDGMSGFKLYTLNGKGILEIDKLVIREDSYNNIGVIIYPELWTQSVNIIKSIVDKTIYLNNYNNYQIGDILRVFKKQTRYKDSSGKEVILVNSLEKLTDDELKNLLIEYNLNEFSTREQAIEDIESYYESLTKFNTLSSIDFSVSECYDLKIVTTDDVDLKNVENMIFKISGNSIKITSNNIDIVQDGIITSTYGDLKETLNISEFGIYSKNGYFETAQYIPNYTLSKDDNSSKFASTKWVKDILTSDQIPSGLIVMCDSNNIPDGWIICNGDNNTPNLSSYSIALEDKNIVYIIKQ